MAVLLSAGLGAANLNVAVFDRDLGIPLEGARVTLAAGDEPVFTDANGRALVAIRTDEPRQVLLIVLPGYDSLRVPFGLNTEELTLEMGISGVIEGDELVVEGEAPTPDEGESGKSVAINRREMETTANIGLVEDVMSSIKTLPGVGYTGSFDAEPSIRGGYPEELATTLDGFYVTYPFQWGGAFSIFNPNMVESAKLSHGVYSARYGRALSGLLEIETIQPDEPRLRVDSSVSTTATDVYLQTPTGESSGLLIGGKVTYLEVMKAVFVDQMEAVATPPYIRNAYGKWNWRPGSRIEVYVNGFFGSDGIGVEDSIAANGVATDVNFDYRYTNAFLAGGLDWAFSDRWRFEVLGGYNLNDMDMDYEVTHTGDVAYSASYIAAYDGVAPYDGDGAVNGLIDNSATFAVTGLDEGGTSETRLQQGQLKMSLERLIGETHVLSAGTEAVFTETSDTSDFTGWMDYWDGGGFELLPYAFDRSVDGNRSLDSAAYLAWEFGLDRQSRLSGELGLRGEQFTIWNEEFNAPSMPVASPRLSLAWKALENRGGLETMNLTFGTGIFADVRLEANLSSDDLKLDTREFVPDRVLSSVVGMETAWKHGWFFSFETYYKHYLNRMVVTGDDGGTGGNPDLAVSTEGKGHVAGFDLMVRKKVGRRLDGYLTYSFIYPRFYNPGITGNPWEEDVLSGEPLDRWFYPYYHRFHNFNLVLNYRPWDGWTFTLKGSFATGTPRENVGAVESYPAEYPSGSGTYIERYSRTSAYSDTLRNGVSIPLDVRIAYGTYIYGSKARLEGYVGAQDILINLYQPDANSEFDPMTGEQTRDTSADFNIGMPILSFGFKVTY